MLQMRGAWVPCHVVASVIDDKKNLWVSVFRAYRDVEAYCVA